MRDQGGGGAAHRLRRLAVRQPLRGAHVGPGRLHALDGLRPADRRVGRRDRPAGRRGGAPREPTDAAPARRNAPQQAGPLGGLLSGMGGGGDFEVEPPDELATSTTSAAWTRSSRRCATPSACMLEHPEDAERYGIEWNGILLHGPPGVGKTFFARAIAGEYGLNLIHVSTGDLVSSLQGGSAQNIDKAFQTALDNLPVPAVLRRVRLGRAATRRDARPGVAAHGQPAAHLAGGPPRRAPACSSWRRRTTSSTSTPPSSDPGASTATSASTCPTPARAARSSRPSSTTGPPRADIDLDELVRRTEGMTPASIAKVVDAAALDGLPRGRADRASSSQLDDEHLLARDRVAGGQDRPTVEHWTWDSLILPPAIKAQLQQLQAIIEDPESARRFGVDPPTGLLLAGPPGTGKTTVAKVLAAQARCSFYPVSGADVMSKWVGESEGNIRRLFERARETARRSSSSTRSTRSPARRGEFQIARQPGQPAAQRDRRRRRPARHLRHRRDEPARPARPGAAARRAPVAHDHARPARRAGAPRDAAAQHGADADGRRPARGARARHRRACRRPTSRRSARRPRSPRWRAARRDRSRTTTSSTRSS